VADWDDADPAVEVALHQVQMALVHKESGPGDQDLVRRYELITQTDEPAELILRRSQVSDKPQTVTIEAHVGRFGDQARETHLIRAVRHRLKALVGKTHAPVTPPS
jgi:hypothetical protein